MNTTPISCPSCGGPVIPLAGKTHVACPYCGTTVTIPESMRITPTQDAPPPKKAKQTFTPPPPRDGDDITDVLSQVEPFAKGAMKAYGFWALLRMLWRRVVPFCAVILMVLCIAMCGLTVFMIFLFQRGV